MAIAFDVRISALGQSIYGLGAPSVDGLGLSTYGFVFLCSSIWDIGDPSVTTVWIDCPDVNPDVETCIHGDV